MIRQKPIYHNILIASTWKMCIRDSHNTNVFTNEPFGEESKQNDFDMRSLFTIDENALQNAFSFDTNQFSQGFSGALNFADLSNIDSSSIDLSGILNLNDIPLNSPQMPNLDMGDIMGLSLIHI